MSWGTGESHLLPPDPPPPYDQIETPFPWAQRVGTVFFDGAPIVLICHAQALGLTPLMFVHPRDPYDVRVVQCNRRFGLVCFHSLQQTCWLFHQNDILMIYIFDPYSHYPELAAPCAVVSE